MEEENRNEDSGGRIPIFQLDSPWAWFYYITFGIQLVAVSYFAAERELAMVVSDSPSETYIAILNDDLVLDRDSVNVLYMSVSGSQDRI